MVDGLELTTVWRLSDLRLRVTVCEQGHRARFVEGKSDSSVRDSSVHNRAGQRDFLGLRAAAVGPVV